MHGLGNDYLYYYGELENPEELSIRLSDRHFGIGSDGIITISNSDVADFKMRIFNADGSEAMMCGNGIRCVGKYVYDKGYTTKKKITVETLSGIKTLNIESIKNGITQVRVDMGTVVVKEPTKLEIEGQTFEYIPVSMGNPHAVIFVDDIHEIELEKIGPKIEKHPNFKDGVNVEFVQVYDQTHLRMRVWERGSGITLACGTGTCASVSAAISKGICPYNTNIYVELDGGTLQIQVDQENQVEMCGPAQTICECEVNA